MEITITYRDEDGFSHEGRWCVCVSNGFGFMTLWDVKPTKRMIRKMKKCVNSKSVPDFSKKFCKKTMKFV